MTDDITDLVIINRELYNRCLKAAQSAEIEERNRFVREHPFFSSWQPKYKKQMAYSITKVQVDYGNHIVRQGTNVLGLYFIVK